MEAKPMLSLMKNTTTIIPFYNLKNAYGSRSIIN